MHSQSQSLNCSSIFLKVPKGHTLQIRFATFQELRSCVAWPLVYIHVDSVLDGQARLRAKQSIAYSMDGKIYP